MNILDKNVTLYHINLWSSQVFYVLKVLYTLKYMYTNWVKKHAKISF